MPISKGCCNWCYFTSSICYYFVYSLRHSFFLYCRNYWNVRKRKQFNKENYSECKSKLKAEKQFLCPFVCCDFATFPNSFLFVVKVLYFHSTFGNSAFILSQHCELEEIHIGKLLPRIEMAEIRHRQRIKIAIFIAFFLLLPFFSAMCQISWLFFFWTRKRVRKFHSYFTFSKRIFDSGYNLFNRLMHHLSQPNRIAFLFSINAHNCTVLTNCLIGVIFLFNQM